LSPEYYTGYARHYGRSEGKPIFNGLYIGCIRQNIIPLHFVLKLFAFQSFQDDKLFAFVELAPDANSHPTFF
jgi:hypothetical protein|tara:strand:- start:18188 stop:18403 length:216 start_codon:yes stop_codon:yes gene_type:complete